MRFTIYCKAQKAGLGHRVRFERLASVFESSFLLLYSIETWFMVAALNGDSTTVLPVNAAKDVCKYTKTVNYEGISVLLITTLRVFILF